MEYVIFDLETTCWESDYPPREREIIEVGAIHLDPFGKELARFECIVRPEQHPRLSSYCTRLTGIVQSDVDHGLSFRAFHQRFSSWLLNVSPDAVFAAWGAADENIIIDACAWHRMPSLLEQPYLDVKAAYHRINQIDKRLGLLKALRREGLEFEGNHHRALPDTINLVRLFRKYLGEWPV